MKEYVTPQLEEVVLVSVENITDLGDGAPSGEPGYNGGFFG